MWAGVALCIGWGTFLTIAGVILAIVGAGFALDYFWRDGLDEMAPSEKALRAEDLVQGSSFAAKALPADKKDVSSNPNPRLPKAGGLGTTSARPTSYSDEPSPRVVCTYEHSP